jgi:DNA-binding CsgD family transcriptional regulator
MPLQEQARQERGFDLNEHLSKRQGEVMALLVQGKTYKAVGGVLGVSENTIRSHVKKIYAKAGVTSRMELLHLLLHPPGSPTEPEQPKNHGGTGDAV